ncbi:hypothetical protein SAMN04488005_0909 [Yoonia tamlensis]|uniref:Beta/Gamma crystallin n=1 Tax=Yoonia tamlensis TaxID=390270 RepID=A0A1I6G1B7_9RHOB|nr:hypothetical protein [Yoonia tamlensis]SFR36013.1 hypothetical protein SAMN04488005_0909 [Yoonia tamlensis]
MLKILLCLMVFASPALAQEPMNATQFETYVEGRTITFLYPGGSTGTESYLTNRRVMWSSQEGICLYGVWYASKGDICFRYDHDPIPKCWRVYLEPDGMRSIFTNNPPYTEIYEMRDRTDPLICHDLNS